MFPAAVPTDADTGVAIRYGIDNHAIILLIRKEKRWIFFENIRYFTLSSAIRMKRHNKTIVNRAKFYVLLCVGSNTEYNPPCPVLAGKQFIG